MKHSYKYKAKNVLDDKWVYGYYLYVQSQDKHYILTGEIKTYPVNISHPHLVTEGFEWIEVKGETVCQFTGLYDCKENEIYEGDIIEYKFDSLGHTAEFYRYVICYSNVSAHFYAKCIGDHTWPLTTFVHAMERATVGGNIYD